jgi:hypothetical protein
MAALHLQSEPRQTKGRRPSRRPLGVHRAQPPSVPRVSLRLTPSPRTARLFRHRRERQSEPSSSLARRMEFCLSAAWSTAIRIVISSFPSPWNATVTFPSVGLAIFVFFQLHLFLPIGLGRNFLLRRRAAFVLVGMRFHAFLTPKHRCSQFVHDQTVTGNYNGRKPTRGLPSSLRVCGSQTPPTRWSST